MEVQLYKVPILYSVKHFIKSMTKTVCGVICDVKYKVISLQMNP